MGLGRSHVPDWEKGWETLPLVGLLSEADPVLDRMKSISQTLCPGQAPQIQARTTFRRDQPYL